MIIWPVESDLIGIYYNNRIHSLKTQRQNKSTGRSHSPCETAAILSLSPNQTMARDHKMNIFIVSACVCRQIADNGVDYVAISGSLVFGGGVTSRSFNLSFLEDTTPETDEYIFIAITNVQLNQSSVDVVDPGALPSVAPGNDSVAFIVISENDDARGVVELSGSRVETPEPSQDFISVLRQAGTFGEVRSLRTKPKTRILLTIGGCLAKDSGLAYVHCCSWTFLVWIIYIYNGRYGSVHGFSQIIVQWEALSGTATSADYSPTRGVVTLANGVQSAPIPLSITEETIPEFSEQFTVRLVGVVGGARLGRLTSATVTITASDNPNGAIRKYWNGIQTTYVLVWECDD